MPFWRAGPVFGIGPVGVVIAALILLGPIIAFPMVITPEMVVDLLMEMGIATDCTLAAGAIGWVLYRKRSARLDGVSQWGPEYLGVACGRVENSTDSRAGSPPAYGGAR